MPMIVALLVAQNSPVSLEDKFSQIQSWYAANKLKKINFSETK